MRARVPVHVRWGDLDAYGHVNNVAMIQLLEEARIALFWHGEAARSAGRADSAHADSATFVVRQEIEYLAPLGYPSEALEIEMWVGRMGASSLDVCYEVPTIDGALAARAVTTIVMVDTSTGKPRRLTPAEREGLAAMTDEPLAFTRRA